MDAAMGAMGLGIVLTLRDQASNGLDKIRAKMSGLQGVTQKMVKDFDANAKKLMAGIGMMWTGSKVFNSFNNLFGSSIQTAANFEQAMAGVAAVSGATGADFERLSAQARQLGRDTQFSASQAANAQELLARAGFQTKEIIQSMPGLLNMAAAEGMGLAEAADIAASSLRGFGMDASEMTRVSNILAQASASSNVSIASLGEALKNVAPDAKSLGLNIEQVSAMIGMLGNAGIKGGRAGTALASALSKISSPGSAAQKALANLGVEIMTQTGDLRNFPDILSELSQAMRAQGLGSAQKGSILKELFGLTTKTEVQALMDAIDTGKLQELSAELLNVGDAAGTMAGKMNATYQGAMKRLESASEGLQIAIGNIFIPVKTWFIDKYASIKSAIAGFIENFPVISKAVLGGAGAIMTLVGSVLTLNGALMAAQGASKIWKLAMKSSGLSVTKALYAPLTRGFMYFKEARQMGLAMSESFRYTFAILRTQAGNSIKGMLQALWSIPGPIKLIVAALGLMAAAYKTNFAGFRDMITAISTGWKFALAASKDGILEVDEATAQQLEKAGLWDTVQNMGKVFFRVLEFFRGFKEGVVEALSFVSNAFSKLGDVFKPFITGGTACLKFLGILSPVVETQASSWRTVGKWVGYAVSALLPLVAVYKTITIATAAWSAAQAVLNIIMSANPIFLIIAAVAALVAAGWWLYNNWDKVVNAIGAAWDWLKNIFISGWEWIKSLFSFEWISSSWDAACDAVSAGWELLKSLFNFDWLNNIFDGVISGWNKLVKVIKAGWNKFTKIFTLDSLKNIWQGLVTGWESVKTWILSGWESFKNWITPDWLKNFWSVLVSSWESAKNLVAQGWESLKNLFSLETLASVWDGLISGWDNAKAKLTQYWNNFKNIFTVENLGKIWDSLLEGWDRVKILIAQGWENLKNSFVGEWAGNIWNGLVTAWDSAKSLIAQGWDSLKNLFTLESLNNIWDSFKSGFEAAKNLISSGWELLKNSFIGEWAANVWSSFKSSFSTAKEFINSGWESLKNIFSSETLSKVWDGFSSAFSGAIGFIKETWTEVANWMGSALNNIWGGITGAWDWIWGNSEKTEQQTVQAQTKDLTILNKMYEGFEAKVQEMTNAWNPFKKSLGEGFENIFNIMKQVGDIIRTHVITAVMELKSSLDLLQSGIENLSRIGNISLNIPASQVQESARAQGAAAGIDKSFKFHALGGIFTQPHMGLVAEAGPEAIIPLSDPSRGVPLLNQAADILGMNNFAMPEFKENASAGILAGLSRNNQAESFNEPQAERREHRAAQANNNMNVRMEAVTTPVYLDGDLIGEFITRFFEHQEMRSGAPALA